MKSPQTIKFDGYSHFSMGNHGGISFKNYLIENESIYKDNPIYKPYKQK